MSKVVPEHRTRTGWCWTGPQAKTPSSKPSASPRSPTANLVLTKLDGTAKGGVVLAISDQLKVPVRLWVWEKMEDLQEFHPMEFVDSLLPESLDA